MRMYYGPRILITNTKNKQQEDLMCQKLEAYEMPPVIMGIENETEQSVDAWYKKHSKKKLKTQVKEGELLYFPAPPCIWGLKEGEE